MRAFVNQGFHYCGRVLLGLFVLWQAFFLASSWFVEVEESLRVRGLGRWRRAEAEFPQFIHGEDQFHKELTDFHEKRLRRYGLATGQIENWSLFSPNITRVISFASVEVRWDDDHFAPGSVATERREPLVLPGFNEPADVNSYLRYRNFRLRKYEEGFLPTPVPMKGDDFDPHSPDWRDRIERAVRQDGDNMKAYLRWRWSLMNPPPGALPKPTQIVLYIHGYEIPEPPGPNPWHLLDRGRLPVVRWLPPDSEFHGSGVLERYDPVTDRYESVP